MRLKKNRFLYSEKTLVPCTCSEHSPTLSFLLGTACVPQRDSGTVPNVPKQNQSEAIFIAGLMTQGPLVEEDSENEDRRAADRTPVPR